MESLSVDNKNIRHRKIHKDKNRWIFFTKLFLYVALMIIQILFLLIVYGVMQEYVLYWETSALLLSAFVVLYIVNKDVNPAYKLAWVVLVLSVPLVGGAMYVLLAGNRTRIKFIKKALKNHLDTFQYMPDDSGYYEEIKELSKSAAAQVYYISKTAGYPVYKNTEVRYFPLGEINFDALIEELNNAKHYIFMEYFIIKEGQMWDEVLEVLKKKVEDGVDVRIIYDDFGSGMGMPSKFIKDMNRYGIRVAAFNQVAPVVNLRQNNRDHRKITVIDGYIGFTGGINLADEYVNKVDRYGHWKDTGIMLKGDAVWNLTLMFLQTWRMLTDEEEDYSTYVVDKYCDRKYETDGYIQPYGDTPVDDEIVGENIYLNMINKAKHYVYIMTPYLIIDNEMITALTLAAKNGIDVRIITPGIPDKKMVYMVTQANYGALVKGGVKIYQYTPGFVHAKTVIVDDKVATVGTVNFDFRSLYLHFECGVWMYESSVIDDIKEDFNDTLLKCEEITLEYINSTKTLKKFGQSVLRLISPLL
ncbi:MAG: cardiolipin synthase [Lachnospiraceae bacterium]|nr:cardiolipin synthase [Lachnospiraceae bacterium]